MIFSERVNLVRDRFSKSAKQYEKAAFIQRDICRELIEKVAIKDGARILDVGCGTGVLVDSLAMMNPSGQNVGIDIAHGMVAAATQNTRGGMFCVSDAGRLPFLSDYFDYVVSSSSYQWADVLCDDFTEAYRVLKPGGKFCVSLFGHKTLQELFESLSATSDSLAQQVNAFSLLPSPDDVQQALDGAGFYNVSLRVESRQVTFESVWSLLLWLKNVGANNLGAKFSLGHKALQQAEQIYIERYGVKDGVAVTFEVIWIEARKDI